MHSWLTTRSYPAETCRKHAFLLRQNQYEGCFHACLPRPGETQVYSLARQQQGILMNLPLKARDALKMHRSSCSIPPALSFFQISLLIPPLSPSHPTVCLTVSLPLSACLPASPLAYPPVCLPACPSTCLPVCYSSLDKTPACCCLMKPTTREMRSRGGKKQRGGMYKVGGFRTQRAKAKCLSETPSLLLCRSSPPARLSAY